ncbi:clarin-3 [Genypterus blacodes]|uniref:clarin-3 n=1 Tax=Genypterus blacodes TaxID=154954 RepID=UPI003F775E07
MPSSKKTLHFLSSALFTSISVGLLGFGLSTQWVEISMDCGSVGSDHVNGSAVITMSLFDGSSEIFCPFGNKLPFDVFTKLSQISTTPLVLHALVVCLSVLCLLFSALSILISLYNSLSNPYETYMGPIGVYTCSSLSACLSFVVLILQVANVNLTDMAEELVHDLALGAVELKNKSVQMDIGYYLLIPYMALSLVAIALIYTYEHAAYTHRREQQKPTEDAPKEIMMY